MGRVTLSERQWKTYVAVWLIALGAVAGVAGGLFVTRLMNQPPPPVLGGGVVMDPRAVAAPDFTLRDQSGRTVSMSGFRGTVVAVTFLDTQCTNLCPLQARFLGTAQSALGASTPLSVVVISVRPGADTPDAITRFAAANGLGGHYSWLTGTPAQLAAVWNEYGVGVQVARGDLEHSSVIYLVDPHGFERVGFLDVPETTAFENDVRILAKG